MWNWIAYRFRMSWQIVIIMGGGSSPRNGILSSFSYDFAEFYFMMANTSRRRRRWRTHSQDARTPRQRTRGFLWFVDLSRTHSLWAQALYAYAPSHPNANTSIHTRPYLYSGVLGSSEAGVIWCLSPKEAPDEVQIDGICDPFEGSESWRFQKVSVGIGKRFICSQLLYYFIVLMRPWRSMESFSFEWGCTWLLRSFDYICFGASWRWFLVVELCFKNNYFNF